MAADAYADAAKAWDDVAPSIALDATWRILREANAYLEANEPWKAEPGPAVDAVLGDALEALRITAVLVSPAVPEVLGWQAARAASDAAAPANHSTLMTRLIMRCSKFGASGWTLVRLH
mgnify:CR=1 FL=1